MVRTQIQMPDRLYDQIRRVAHEEETSLTEVIRRAVGDFLAARPEAGHRTGRWSPPGIRDTGRLLAGESQWKSLANESDLVPQDRSGGDWP